MKRWLSAAAVATLMPLVAVACSGAGASPACASTLDAQVFAWAQAAVQARGGTGGTSGGFSGGGVRSAPSRSPSPSPSRSVSGSSGASTGRSGVSPSKAPTNAGVRSIAPTNSGVRTAPSGVSPKSSYTPPRNTVIVVHGQSYPSSYGHSYTASNGHVYVIHTHDYYSHAAFPPDPLDVYDYRNFTNPLSPYYGIHVHC